MLVITFIIGLVIGSFLNVVIYRLPREKSIISPRSFCPSCNEPIKPYDNLPVLSFILLKGKCRSCKAPIPYRYPLVELLTATIFSWLYSLKGLSLEFFVFALFVCLLIAISFIDLEFQIIPDVLSLGGLFLGILFSIFRKPNFHFLDSLYGLLIGAGILWGTSITYELIKKREGVGFGDVKLLGMIGAFLGPYGAIFSLIFGSFLGALVGIAVITAKRRDFKYAIPFGPFLSLAAVAYTFWGERITRAAIDFLAPSWRL